LEPRRRTALLVGVALVARILYWLSTLDYRPVSDADSYNRIAMNLAHGRGFSDTFPQLAVHETAFRPPGFPVVLAGVYRVFGDHVAAGRVLNLVIGIAVVLLTAQVANRIAGPVAALAAGLVVAVYPPLVVNDVTLLTESMSLLLLLLIVLAVADDRWLLAGVETGLLILTRHSAQALPILVGLLFIRWVGWKRAAAYVGVSFLVVVPWLIRNQIQLGSPVLNTANGFNLNAMYSPEAHASDGFVDAVYDDRFQQFRLKQFDEVEWDSALRGHGIDGLRDHPTDLLKVPATNLEYYFELAPDNNVAAERLDGRNIDVRKASLPLFYVVTIAGVIGLWLFRRDRMAMLFGAIAIYFTLASLFFIAAPRLRAPFDLACCLGAGLLVAHLWARRRGRSVPEAVETEGDRRVGDRVG
jgi:4-amino-4-deoxy-L-arabinose transferase-like glycosyltransferase